MITSRLTIVSQGQKKQAVHDKRGIGVICIYVDSTALKFINTLNKPHVRMYVYIHVLVSPVIIDNKTDNDETENI